jgi:TldD protein
VFHGLNYCTRLYPLPEGQLLKYGSGVNKTVDADFLALPLAAVSDAAISTAKEAGASHVDVRIERTRSGYLSLRDARPETQSDETIAGVGVRVIVNGAWGFASSPEISVDVAKKLALTAVAMAKTSKPLSTELVSLVAEPVYANQMWVSEYEIDLPTQCLLKNRSIMQIHTEQAPLSSV